jgi:trigger factor
MEKKIKKGNQANYEIEIIVTSAEQDEAKQVMLKQFQKDFEMTGFRKGFAPLDVVEKNTKPEYLTMGIYEHLINKGLQEILKENEKMRFIGEPYDLKQEQKADKTHITLKLDIFPEVEVLNNDREKEQLPEIKSEATPAEIENAIISLKKNYADYKDAEIITLDTISKIEMEFLDKDGKVLEKAHNYVGEQEFTEGEFYKKEFLNKKK